ncbi:MAG TPA: deoxyribose-phosphate aldolase [Rhodothermales bacterium]|nr:deoxyribose-phosphate aldolase [Rhodothermales bacterium]
MQGDELTPVPEAARELARRIDHTALKPETTEADVRRLCDEARQYGFATVCINPCYVPLAYDLLLGTAIGVCAAIGFPLGANVPELKAEEAARAVGDGAAEVDVVLNVGMLKSGRYTYVEDEIRTVVEAVRAIAPPHVRTVEGQVLVKVILETALLTDDEKVTACGLAERAGADFVKTSTGFSKGGATAADVALMRRTVGDRLSVKASGGIRTLADAQAMVAAGADRIGASASVAIVTGRVGEDRY